MGKDSTHTPPSPFRIGLDVLYLVDHLLRLSGVVRRLEPGIDPPMWYIAVANDVVWLQVNALSHKYYYRIIGAARKNGILVRYFGSTSAQKCAVQLALDELHTV